jgi:hypothetical protein
MIRSWTLAAIAGGLAAYGSIDAAAADPLPTQTFKILPAALAVEAAEASSKSPRQARSIPRSTIPRW